MKYPVPFQVFTFVHNFYQKGGTGVGVGGEGERESRPGWGARQKGQEPETQP